MLTNAARTFAPLRLAVSDKYRPVKNGTHSTGEDSSMLSDVAMNPCGQCRIKTLEALVHSEKMRPTVERGLWRGSPPPQGWVFGGITPGKIFKFETQFGAIWCILARN